MLVVEAVGQAVGNLVAFHRVAEPAEGFGQDDAQVLVFRGTLGKLALDGRSIRLLGHVMVSFPEG